MINFRAKRAYLEDDLIRLRDESRPFELSAGNDLRLDDSFFLADPCLFHVFLLQQGQLRMVLQTKIKKLDIIRTISDFKSLFTSSLSSPF